MGCPNCEEGLVVVCPDDLCRGAGHCMHGDGMETCPVCHGDDEFGPVLSGDPDFDDYGAPRSGEPSRA